MKPVIAPGTLRAKHFGCTLPNGVKCIIAHDPTAKLPAVAMNIGVGSLSDPSELPGLAHFCEHMLFMGTAKFPREDEYDRFISKHNGHNNAWTADCGTTYYFQVSDEALEGALERFIPFFVSPNFNEGAVARELQAVQSEDEKNHRVDYWRLDELYRTLFNPKHPHYRYGNGNITTLRDDPVAAGIDVRDGLKKFYSRYYHAGAACIAIYSPRPPAEILKLIEEPLLALKPGPANRFTFLDRDEQLFSGDSRRCWLNVKSVRKSRQVSVMWPVRSSHSLWRAIPAAYISHILGHECDSSVLGILKRMGMATSMTAGSRRIDDDFEVFVTTITLSAKGFQHVLDVIRLLYQSIGQAIEHGIDPVVYNEMKAEQKLSFQSDDVSSPSDHCTHLATNANETDLEHCWIGGQSILEDDLPASLDYARQLTPDTGIVTLSWGEFTCVGDALENDGTVDGTDDEEGGDDIVDETENAAPADEDLFRSLPVFAQMFPSTVTRFHRTPHAKISIPDDVISDWAAALEGPYDSGLALPPANPFLCTDCTVYPKEEGQENAVVKQFTSPHGLTLIRKDAGHHNSFKASVRWTGLSPVAYATPLNSFYTRVMRDLVTDALTEVCYFGELSSLTNEVVIGAGGLGVRVEGPYSTLRSFFLRVLDSTLDVAVLKGSHNKFDTYCEKLIRSLRSQATNQPFELAMDRLFNTLLYVHYTFDTVVAAASSASYEGYTQFVDDYLRSGLRFECFIAGNMPSAESMKADIVEGVEAALAKSNVTIAEKHAIPRFRDAFNFDAAPGSSEASLGSIDLLCFPPFSPEEQNVAVLLDVCVGKECARTRALCDATDKLLSSSFFNALRTREALGYIVFSTSRCVAQTANLLFVAQSALVGVDGVYLLSRIAAFFAAVEAQLDTLCREEDLQQIVAGLIAAREKLPDSVKSDAATLEVDYLHPTGLEHRKEEIARLKELTVADIKTFFQDVVLGSRKTARAMAVVVNSGQPSTCDPLMSPGKRFVALPPQRPTEVTEDMMPDEASDSLQLPTFANGDSAIDIRVWESIKELQAGRNILRSTTF